MAENAGHLVDVGIDDNIGGPFTALNGVTSVSLTRDRTVLDKTHFNDATGHKLKLMGLKDTKIEMSGNQDLADTGQGIVRSRYGDGASTFVEIQWDGSTSADGEFKVSAYNESADVDDLVKFSATFEGSPDGGASNVWG